MANFKPKCFIILFTFCSIIHPIFGVDLSPDFIVVGSGVSGSVVAGRLSKKYSVLLLEAGGKPDDTFDIPAKVFSTLGKSPNHSKIYKSIPQENASRQSPNNGQMDYVIGTKLGGGSAVNAMIYNRGSPHDYNNWANITNDPSWSYDNLLKYFKRMEDYQGGFPSEDYHGTGGPLPISTSKYAPGQKAWFEAGEWLGFPTNLDPNGPQIPSFTPVEFIKRHGRRVSAYDAYVKPYLKSRPFFKVISNAEVKRIIFNEDNSRAIGVTYVTKNKDGSRVLTMTVGAKKEVIISAGVMDTPAILMISGIGPKEVLEESNINEVKILPVGYNLQDHVLMKLEFHLNKEADSDVLVPERDLNEKTWKYFEETGDGPYASLSGIHGEAFLVSKIRKAEAYPNPEWPDIQLIQQQSSEELMIVPMDKEEREKDYVPVYVLLYVGRPKSRGRVTLNKDNVDGPPVIDFQLLADPQGHDLAIYLEALEFTINMYENAPSFQKQGARFSYIVYKPCAHFEFRSDDYFKCFVRHLAGSGLHGGGTCRMGRSKGDKDAVVDSKLKVIGIDGLRVVDLSIMPDITNANTQAAAYVIGEKAADMILEEWGRAKNEL